ncbi:hypothetical protein [Spiroplasma monobiae]|uniref:Lipoprotein n=1 Tax=Spiroplasma monobiae MQ-1 TaxID=1336748 RepID=A0A2K9LTV5_SPISQ|nr:hypothetical protein [Spiroplasma monobiae]AUM62440.1 hypothetical protein SMONO_v1c01890 [Spiroplasma monobiae MQ-1]
MKKLLSFIGAMTLTTSTIAISTTVVSCNATWSMEFKSIIEKEVRNLFNDEYYNISKNEITKDVSIFEFDEIAWEYKPRKERCDENEDFFSSELSIEKVCQPVNTFSLRINEEIQKNETKLKILADSSFELFLEASSYFDSLVPEFDENKEDENEYYYYVLDDEVTYGKASKEISYDSEKDILDYFGDEIINPIFQKTATQFAVLRNNLEFLKAFLLIIKSKTDVYSEEYIKNIQYMVDYLDEGWFIPMFKIIRKEKVVSQGTSMTKMKYDKDIVRYLDVGSNGTEILEPYEGLWMDSPPFGEEDLLNPKMTGFIRFNPTEDELKSQQHADLNSIAASINTYEVNRIYGYGDLILGGKK